MRYGDENVSGFLRLAMRYGCSPLMLTAQWRVDAYAVFANRNTKEHSTPWIGLMLVHLLFLRALNSISVVAYPGPYFTHIKSTSFRTSGSLLFLKRIFAQNVVIG